MKPAGLGHQWRAALLLAGLLACSLVPSLGHPQGQSHARLLLTSSKDDKLRQRTTVSDPVNATAHGDHAQGMPSGHSWVAAQQQQQVEAFHAYSASIGLPTLQTQRHRRLQQGQPSTIRIAVYSQLDSLSATDQAAAMATVDVAVRVMKKFLQVTSPQQGKLYVRPQLDTCDTATIPAALSAGSGAGVAADYILFVTAKTGASGCHAGVIAYALACDYDSNTKRPTVGTVNLCSGAFGSRRRSLAESGAAGTDNGDGGSSAQSGGNERDMVGAASGRSVEIPSVSRKAARRQLESGSGGIQQLSHRTTGPQPSSSDLAQRRGLQGTSKSGGSKGARGTLGNQIIDTLVHELIHALGFVWASFPSYINPNTGDAYGSAAIATVNGVNYLATPTVTQQASQLLGCDSLPGGQLENEGGAGQAQQHWEFRLFNQDVMTPLQLYGMRARMTGLTLGALQDSGWYTPRWNYVQPLDGKLPKGCDLPTLSCQAYDKANPGTHYCSGDTANKPCQSPTAPTVCGPVNTFSDGCQVLRPGIPCDDAAAAAAVPPSLVRVKVTGFGGNYGPSGRCHAWAATGTSRRGGCFATSCSGGTVMVADGTGGSPAQTCPVGGVYNIKDGPAGARIACPANSAAASTMCQSLCQCDHGQCLPSGKCVCDMEYMGPTCSKHVQDVTDFN